MIIELRQYMNEKGDRVDERVPVSIDPNPVLPPNVDRFIGHAQMQRGNQILNVSFRIPAQTIEEALGMWESAAAVSRNEIELKMQRAQNALILPGGNNGPKPGRGLPPLKL